MAKVKQFKTRLQLGGTNDYHDTVVEICYDNTDPNDYHHGSLLLGRFYIKLPKVVADALGKTEVRAVDQIKVVEVFNEAIKKFKELKTETNRVILYQFVVDPEPGKDHTQYNSGITIKVWAGTFIETIAIAGNGAKRYSYEKAESSLKYPVSYDNSPFSNRDAERIEKQIPWTEENEKFFFWVQKSMENLAECLFNLSSPKALAESISAGRLLPMGADPLKQESIL